VSGSGRFTSNLLVEGSLTASGNVGIGTASPSEKLSISGNTNSYTALQISNGAAGGRSYGFASTDNTNGNGGGKFGIFDFTAAAYRMMIDNAGNVGIGMTSPIAKLQIAGTGTAVMQLGSSATAADNWHLTAETAGVGTRDFTIWNGNYLGGAQRLTILNGGNVGIATTSPGAQLQVNSSAAGTIGSIIKGAASQSADLLQAQNSSSSVLAQITSDGTIKSSVGVYVGNDQLSSVLQNQIFS
jgi:hypothetical protein